MYTISEHVVECETELRLFQTEDMQKKVADLYAHVFLFLNDMMDWYMQKRRSRFVDSFNEKFFQKFEAEIENIRRKSDLIKRRATQNIAAEIRVGRLTAEGIQQDIRVGLEGVLRKQAEQEHNARRTEEYLRAMQQEWREGKQHIANLSSHLVQWLTDIAQTHRQQGNPPYATSQNVVMYYGQLTK